MENVSPAILDGCLLGTAEATEHDQGGWEAGRDEGDKGEKEGG